MRRAAGRRRGGASSSTGPRPRRAPRGSGTRLPPAAAGARARGSTARAASTARRATRAGAAKPKLIVTLAQRARTCTSACGPGSLRRGDARDDDAVDDGAPHAHGTEQAGSGGGVWRKATAWVEPTSRAPAGQATRTVSERLRTAIVTTTLRSGCVGLKPAARAVTPVRARPPPPRVGMQPMNGWKLDDPAPTRVRTRMEDDAATGRHARSRQGCPARRGTRRRRPRPPRGRRSRRRCTRRAGRPARSRRRPEGTTTHGPATGRQTGRPLHSSAASAVPAGRAASAQRAATRTQNDDDPHSGLLVHASESPEASEQQDDADAGERRGHLTLLALLADPAAEIAVHLLQPLGRRRSRVPAAA